jgi:hypothetical protein
MESPHDPRSPYYNIVDDEPEEREGQKVKKIGDQYLVQISPMQQTFLAERWKKS